MVTFATVTFATVTVAPGPPVSLLLVGPLVMNGSECTFQHTDMMWDSITVAYPYLMDTKYPLAQMTWANGLWAVPCPPMIIIH